MMSTKRLLAKLVPTKKPSSAKFFKKIGSKIKKNSGCKADFNEIWGNSVESTIDANISQKPIYAETIPPRKISADGISTGTVKAQIISGKKISAKNISSVTIAAETTPTTVSADNISAKEISAKIISAETICANEITAQSITVENVPSKTVAKITEKYKTFTYLYRCKKNKRDQILARHGGPIGGDEEFAKMPPGTKLKQYCITIPQDIDVTVIDHRTRKVTKIPAIPDATLQIFIEDTPRLKPLGFQSCTCKDGLYHIGVFYSIWSDWWCTKNTLSEKGRI